MNIFTINILALIFIEILLILAILAVIIMGILNLLKKPISYSITTFLSLVLLGITLFFPLPEPIPNYVNHILFLFSIVNNLLNFLMLIFTSCKDEPHR